MQPMDIKAHLAKLAQRMTIDQIARAASVNRATVVRAKAGRNITVATLNALLSIKAVGRTQRKDSR